LKQFKSKKLLPETLSRLIKLLEKYQKQEEVLQELQITMLWVLKLDLLIVHKDKFKKEKKSSIQSLYIKLMLSTQDLKDFWLYFQELLDK
jgi:hypothetical protein